MHLSPADLAQWCFAPAILAAFPSHSRLLRLCPGREPSPGPTIAGRPRPRIGSLFPVFAIAALELVLHYLEGKSLEVEEAVQSEIGQ